MLNNKFVQDFTHSVYDLVTQRIEKLTPISDERSVYRIHTSTGSTRILRLQRSSAFESRYEQTGQILLWLQNKQYAAPQLHRTSKGTLVGVLNGWCSLLLTYIDGEVMNVQSEAFAEVGTALGQLHSLILGEPETFSQSRCSPNALAHTYKKLDYGQSHLPDQYRSMADALKTSLIPLIECEQQPRLTHGDCWYMNAIKTVANQTVLIDWDCAGTGIPIIDVGYLLLTAHYNLANPLQVEPSEKKVRSILTGYQIIRLINRAEIKLLPNAIRFALAFHLGAYLDERRNMLDDIVLRKMQARFEATSEIAQLAVVNI